MAEQPKDYEQEIQWRDVTAMTQEELQQELSEQRAQFELMEKDLFRHQTQKRKLEQQIKTLSAANQAQKVNTNNTSSAFTLPSEFKQLWDELVSDVMLDSFPDFLDDFQLFVGFIQQLFIQVREDLILRTKQDMVISVAKTLNLLPNGDFEQSEETNKMLAGMEKKLQSVFQDDSQRIFEFSEGQLKDFVNNHFKPKCVEALKNIGEEGEEKIDMFVDNVDSADFIRFLRAIVKLQLHMVLNDPPIEMSLLTINQRAKEEKKPYLEKFEFWMYNKTDYYCIDGFPKEGNPCVVVLPPPYRQGYVYQGIKPAVVVLSESDFATAGADVDYDQLCIHVSKKQEEVLEKIKSKRAKSLMAEIPEKVPESKKEEQTVQITQIKHEGKSEQSFNITQIKHDSVPIEEQDTQELSKLPEFPSSAAVSDGESSPGKPELAECRAPLTTQVEEHSDRPMTENQSPPSAEVAIPSPRRESYSARKSPSGFRTKRSSSKKSPSAVHSTRYDKIDEELEEKADEQPDDSIILRSNSNPSLVKPNMDTNPRSRLASNQLIATISNHKQVESEQRRPLFKRDKTSSFDSNSAQKHEQEVIGGLTKQMGSSISTGSQASIIAEMHYQRGMNDIRTDLQRKIYSYQSILKKTHLAAEQRKADKKKVSSIGALEAAVLNTDRSGSGNESRNQAASAVVKNSTDNMAANRQAAKLFNDQLQGNKQQRKANHIETGCKPTGSGKYVHKTGGINATRQSNIDTLQNLKSAYFSKMQSLNKKLENDRANHRKQLEKSRQRTSSRSKSPIQQQNRNMPRQLPQQAKIMPGPKMGAGGLATAITSRPPSYQKTLQMNGKKVGGRKPSLKTTTTQSKRKYSHNAKTLNHRDRAVLHTGEVATGSSNSTVSSQFDESDSDEEMLKYGKETQQSVTNAYEPISRSLRQGNNINVVDDLSSGSDDDDEDIGRPGISQTFYQPDSRRIANNKRTLANVTAGHESVRVLDVINPGYVPPRQLQTYHNQLVSGSSMNTSQTGLSQNGAQPMMPHSLRYSPSTVSQTVAQTQKRSSVQSEKQQRLLSPKQVQQVARRTRDAYTNHQKRVSSGSRQPTKNSGSAQSTLVNPIQGAGPSASIQKPSKPRTSRERAVAEQSAYSHRTGPLSTTSAQPRATSSRFYQPPTQYANHSYVVQTANAKQNSPSLHNCHSSKGVLVNNFF